LADDISLRAHIDKAPPIVAQVTEVAVIGARTNRNAAFSALGRCLLTLRLVVRQSGATKEGNAPMADDLASKLRAADEDTVDRAMDHACVSWPIKDRTELPEAFNCFLDVPDADGHVFEPEEL